MSGFITDASDGRPIQNAHVLFYRDTTLAAGATTERDGLYLTPYLPAGRYAAVVSHVGYQTTSDTLRLTLGETRTYNVALKPASETLEEVLVRSGSPDLAPGQEVIRPEDLQRLPTPDVAGDLASYLTAMPGVTSIGDRGGQLFIRGGEPAHMLVQLDGAVLYQPFHLLGFYSAFPSEIIQQADVYAGGFSSRFGERISSVIDVRSRSGNMRTPAASLALSPFVSSGRLEGPLWKDRLSLLVYGRRSLLEHGASRYVNTPLPFRFGDLFAKLEARPGDVHRLSLTALRTYDHGSLGEELAAPAGPRDIRWTNRAMALRYLWLPGNLPMIGESQLSIGHLQSAFGPASDPIRTSSIANVQGRFRTTFVTDRSEVEMGLIGRVIPTRNRLGAWYQNIDEKATEASTIALYVDPQFHVGPWEVRPGLRLQILRASKTPLLEPRLQISYQTGAHQISAAGGLYHQELIGLVDRRDAANVFTAWTHTPRENENILSNLKPSQPSPTIDIRAGRLPRAIHGIVGYSLAPISSLEVTAEAYYKDLSNLFVTEWTAFPRFTHTLQPADGRSFGLDSRLEFRQGSLFAQLGYGLSFTRYAARSPNLELWYGRESMQYTPPHNQRHQLHLLAGGKVLGFDLGIRWRYGSGRPFTQPRGFDGLVVIGDIERAVDLPSRPRVIYGEPFGTRLPAFHQLDLSVRRSVALRHVDLTVQASMMNVYNRPNVFFLDTFTGRRIDQLPRLPSLSIKAEV